MSRVPATPIDNVRALVRAGIAGLDVRPNLHGIEPANVERHIVEPPILTAISDGNGALFDGWIVLDEHPGNAIEGYLMILDNETREFGLSVKARAGSIPILIGLYGSFATTLEAM